MNNTALPITLTVLVALLLTTTAFQQDAHALCLTQPEDGAWINTDAQTRSLTRIELRFTCQDQILNGQPYPPGPPWHLHLWGSCSPQNCDWGEVGAQRLSSNHIYASYDQGFARRFVYARMSQYRPGQLWVYTYTDFTDPDRSDYDVHNWFVREGSTPPVACDTRGSSSLFVAGFESDTVGSLPVSTGSLHYGPPGSSLNISGPANSAMVVDSASLGSKALKITRQSSGQVNVAAVLGDNGTAPYQSGTYYLEYMAHGEIVPSYLIAGAAISSRSAENKFAFNLKLFDSAYHELQASNYSRMIGTYDVSDAHFVHVELNMDQKQYSICIDNEIVTSGQSLVDGDFSNLFSLQFFMPEMVTEGFPSEYVIDDIRVTK
jgi:hypothetical protein